MDSITDAMSRTWELHDDESVTVRLADGTMVPVSRKCAIDAWSLIRDVENFLKEGVQDE